MILRLQTGLALAACLLLAGRAAAQSEPRPPRITAVRVVADGAVAMDRGFVDAHLGTRAGHLFDRQAVGADVRALLDTERFTDVRAEAVEEGEGVALVFTVVPRPRLAAPPAIRGAARIGVRKIIETLDLQTGDYVDTTLLDQRGRRVQDMYRKASYAIPGVTAGLALSETEPGWCTATITVREADAEVITGRTVTGVRADPGSWVTWPFNPVRNRLERWSLRPLMDMPLIWNVPVNLWRWFFPRAYDERATRVWADNMRTYYRERGYWDAEVSGPFATPLDGSRLHVAYKVEQGPLYRAGRIDVLGVRLFETNTFDRLHALRPGEVLTMPAIQGALRQVRDRYGELGYLGAWVEHDLTPAGPGVMDVTIRVRDEGRLTRVGRVDIRGNQVTREKVILREIHVYPGEPYNEVKVARAERQLRGLNYFEMVRSYPSETAPGVADLIMEVTEKPTGMLSLGASFSSLDSLVGNVELTQGNFDLFNWPSFMGGGQRLKLAVRAGRKLSEYSISFIEPWFWDKPLSLGVDGYLTRRSYSEYVLQRTGGSLSLSYPTPLGFNTEWRYRLERVVLDDVKITETYIDTDGASFRFTEEETRVGSTLGLTLWRDRRDSQFIPSRGYRLSATGALTGGPLGFDTDIYRLSLRGEQHVPLWWGHVLSFRASADVVDAFGDTDKVPLAERLYAGGPRTVRGFKYRAVGPKAYRDIPQPDGSLYTEYRPRGGQTLLLGSVEYTTPLPVPYIRLAAFGDIGSLAEDAYDFSCEELAWSAGIGIRLDIPNFPIRFDYALDSGVITPRGDRDETEVDRLNFWVGYGF